MITWRIGSGRFPADTSGGNAGRWNHKGVPVIYTASSIALCALEILASRGPELPVDYVVVPVEIPTTVPITTLSAEELPQNWWANPHPAETRDIGSSWARDLRTAVLSVPSAVIRRERNYILNPAHADFALLSFGDLEPFLWDERLKRPGKV